MEGKKMKTDGSDQNEKLNNLERSPIQSFKEIMNSEYVKKRFMEVMGEKSTAFLASILNAVQKNPELAKCDTQTILSSAMVAATLDLPIDSNLGFSAIVPYNTKRKDKNGKEYWVALAQFQIMYKGFIQLALRSGQYKTINVAPVYEDEFESYDIITGDIIIHPVEGGYRYQEIEEKIIGYAAFFRLLNGYERIEYWSVKKLEAHGKKYSKSFDNKNGLWKKNPHAMYAKTVLKNTLSKWGILSVSMQNAIAADQAVIKAFDKTIDGDNIRYIDTTEFSSEETGPEVDPGVKKETVPASGSSAATPQQTQAAATAGIAPQNGNTGAAARADTANGGGKGKDELFDADEDAAMQEAYERHMAGTPGPDFG
jgi:recombination protein RecT